MPWPFSSGTKISDAASHFNRIIREDDVGQAFYDSLLVFFMSFDEYNRTERNRLFSNDVEYIAKTSIDDITSFIHSKRSSQRLDSYFYIYYRIDQYLSVSRPNDTILVEFRQKLFELLASRFKATNGREPDIRLKDGFPLQEVNIFQHLSSVVIKDEQSLNTAFALFKLSIQSSLIIHTYQNRLKWKDMLTKVRDITLPVEDFVKHYNTHKSAFQQLPLDVSGFIYLIQKKRSLKSTKILSYTVLIGQAQILKIDIKTFYKEFQPIFDNDTKNDRCPDQQIADFLLTLSLYDDLFLEYFTIYSSNVLYDNLWKMFLNLSKNSNLNDTMRKHLSSILTQRVSTVTSTQFREYITSAKEHLKKLTSQAGRSSFLEIFEQIYDTFILYELQKKGYMNQVNNRNLKELLNVDSSLIPKEHFTRPSNLMVIQQLLFRSDASARDPIQKLRRIFENLEEFNATICRNHSSIGIIEDEWLTDVLLVIPQGWVQLSPNDYKYLCNHHQNNLWTTHVWSRMIQLSLSKKVQENVNPTLVKLNDWMKTVGHQVYDANDFLTIVFVKNLFEIFISKYIKSILLLPNIEAIVQFVMAIKQHQPKRIDVQLVDEFVQRSQQEIEQIFRLKHSRLIYRELLKGSVIRCFLPFIDLAAILKSIPPQFYRLPATTAIIDNIVSIQKPNDIDTQYRNSNEDFFDRFVQEINDWFPWFDKFIEVFQPVIEWLKTYNVTRAVQLSLELNTIKEEAKMTVDQFKMIVDGMSRILATVNDLQRLCYLLNCLSSFRIINRGTLNDRINVTDFIRELELSQPHNTFTVQSRTAYEHRIPIIDHQKVFWSLASKTHACNIQIQYQTDQFDNELNVLYGNNNIPIQRNVLSGQFETERSGQLIINIDNKQSPLTHVLWYRIRSINLSTCQLFQGILNMVHTRYYGTTYQPISEKEFSAIIQETFKFIDDLLNGSLTLRQMGAITAVFCDRNIHIREEVEKLLTSRSIEQPPHAQEIDQVCEWLQIYQYYSHITIIMECITKFDILADNNDDESIGRLQLLRVDDNCTLREITQAYQILQQRFQNLTSQHLQLIKTVVECSNVVSMMKKADLYSDQGRGRFQGLRDNLTTQFQLQEKNNMILNSWIITYSLVEPFVHKVNRFDDFLARIAQLPNVEEASLNHIKTVNDNIKIVNMWLSAEDASVLDNALITMEHLYKSGSVEIHLRHLMKEQSYFVIPYYIDRTQGQAANAAENDEHRQEIEQMKFTLSMADVEDHKRQLTFCYADVEQNAFYSKGLIDGQLKLLQTMERIFLTLKKLEMAGHPDYQLRDEHYDIHLRLAHVRTINFRDQSAAPLEQVVKTRTDTLEKGVHQKLTEVYENWIVNLERIRKQCVLLKLFSNRQIMILILLLRQSTSPNSTRIRFLKNLYSFRTLTNQTEEEQQFILHCLKHNLSSLRLRPSAELINVYGKHQIPPGANTETCLKTLANFLQELFHNGDELMQKPRTIDNSQQYLVTLNPTDNKDNNLDMNTFCILLNIFNQRLPAPFQILWCSTVTLEDIELFFDRIRTFRYLIFVIMDIDKMNHRLREILFNHQDLLTRDQVEHGTVFYFSKELTTSRHGLREFVIPHKYRDAKQTYAQLRTLLQRDRQTLPELQIIGGDAGIGKTHRIKSLYEKDGNFSCFSINDNLNLPILISSFLLFDSKMRENTLSIYFNISIQAPFEQLNRTLFSLFICGSLMDAQNGLVFTLPIERTWKFIVEVPYSKTSNLSIRDNFNRILPLLSIISPQNFEEVNSGNYQLHIGKEEEQVARFLKAFANGTINRVLTIDQNNVEHEVSFDEIADPNESRALIDNCITNNASELPRNKIIELSFTKFLHRRVQFFLGPFYRMNQTKPELGSTAMRQMINEAASLTNITFENNGDPFRVYLVYDPGFALRLLHNDWNRVTTELKKLFDNQDPVGSIEYRGKDYLIVCLAWLINISYDYFKQIMEEKKFILTENFAYKLFHIHERKLTKLPLIIEGETGVGKTFLLKFYSSLLNASYIKDPSRNSINPHIVQNANQWLLETIEKRIETQPIILSPFVQQMKQKILGLDEENNVNQAAAQQQDPEFLKKIKLSLKDVEYDEKILYFMWKTILTISNDNHLKDTMDLIESLRDYITSQLSDYPLIEPTDRLLGLLQITDSPTIQQSMNTFEEYLNRYQIKPLFYRLLLHPGISEEQIAEFMKPIIELARQLSTVELVVFFDEVNTASCLGLFKEMFMDGTIHGRDIPKNIFFTAAINPYRETKEDEDSMVFRSNFIVHKLPESLNNLVVQYGILESRTMGDYIYRKIKMFQISSTSGGGKAMPLDDFVQKTLADCILVAQEFCERRLARNSVSQREIQRCFSLIEFFWRMRYDHEINNGQIASDPNPIRCIALSLALIYYFRLPTNEDNAQRNDRKTPSREELGEILSRFIPDFEELVQIELENFVNTDNFFIPPGVAINQAIREHIFAIVVSVVTRTPLCIIGVPGQSKTLSFHIVVQNLQGPQLSPKPFCKRLPSIDPFYCLGSKYSRAEDIAYSFDRAIRREQHYEQNRIETRCVVFLDEASLPDENKMVLKVLHPYLDDGKVAFVAIANKAFDAANANRMLCIYRSLPSESDQKILAYGCLGLDRNHNQLDHIIHGLCQGYRRIRRSHDIPRIFHDRDFIYMLRELRFELSNNRDNEGLSIAEITPLSLLRALEDNFNGIKQRELQTLVDIFFQSVEEKCPNFSRGMNYHYRDIPTIFRQSMTLDSKRRKLYGRYKLVIDESEDESAVHLLFQSGILDPDPNRTTIFRMSDFPDDIGDELRNVEILSRIKLCMETGKTILMVNTGRIHGSLYDVFNQDFSIMATDDTRKIFSKVAIGPKTVDVAIHENFQCIVHIKRSEFKDIPAPFLSRFQKYVLGVTDSYSILSKQLPPNDQKLLETVEEKVHSFIQHFGQQYFSGLNESTLHSCLLNLIKKDDNGQYYLSNIHRSYSQLNSESKTFIEQNSTDMRQSILYLLISKLMQLVAPESMIYKLPTFNDGFARLLCENYFYQQEHFSVNNFIERFLSSPNEEMTITTKVMISTRTSVFTTGLNNESKVDLLNKHEKIDIINLAVIENSPELQERFDKYKGDPEQQVLMIVIDGRIAHQRLHIPFIRQMIDENDKSCNRSNEVPQKFFIILIHSTKQELDHRSSFPSIFLHDWDHYFLDTSTSGSAFHLQKMLQILTSSFNTTRNERQDDALDNNICDLKTLFNDCLWEFCARIQVPLQDPPADQFQNPSVCEFYQRQTTTRQRIECLKDILRQSQQLEQRIVSIFHENGSNNRNSFDKTCRSIYQISKDVLCGKRSNSLVDSLQSKIRTAFTNFASNILKFIVNDYGLETLHKLSTDDKSYQLLLNLIDYSSFLPDDSDEDDDLQSPSTIQGTFQLTSHYSCIPQTPLYHLFQQRIKTLADEIKLKLQLNEPVAEIDNDYDRYARQYDDMKPESSSQQFRNQLVESITNDKILAEIISPSILQSFTLDTVRLLCSVVEKSFENNIDRCQKTIDFITHWLLLTDQNDSISLENAANQSIWLLAHVYTFFEYDQHDLLSLFSICRIMDQLGSTQAFYENIFQTDHPTRSTVREELFGIMFDNLWKNLCDSCSSDSPIDQWVHSYTFISKYYPSDKVLQHMQQMRVKSHIEFMNLAYLIFLNEKTPQVKGLISRLLTETKLIQDDIDGRMINMGGSICLKLLSTIINTIDQHLRENNAEKSTTMIDIQHWIISTLKSSNESCEPEIKELLKFLNQPTNQLSLSMKQFLFDELMNILFQRQRQNQPGGNKQKFDFWDRLKLLPTISACIGDENVLNYQLPYHPSIVNERQTLFDLFFFHLRRIASEDAVSSQLIHKIVMSTLPTTTDRRLVPIVEKIFGNLKDYFVIELTAVLFCEKDLNKLEEQQQQINNTLNKVINGYLAVDAQSTTFSPHVQHFLATIITKRSWNYLLNLLKSERFQLLNAQWSNTVHGLIEIKHNTPRNKYLQLSHQLQFTLSTNNTLSIFPELHQPFDELSKLIDQGAQSNDQAQRWKPLTDWVQLQLTANPQVVTPTQIKVMLLLHIYYNYYCNNQLRLLDSLIAVIQNSLQPLAEELRVFNALLQPEQHLIGYAAGDNNLERNQLNNLFQLDCMDDDELSIRHALVNLLAMILLGETESFLWTFTFEPLKLLNTVGFGSTRPEVILANGVHYDCGCILTENGDLVHFPNSKGVNSGALNAPAVYIAYFSTFGAMAWHMLLFNKSEDNLYGPILAKHAIDDTNVVYRIAGDTIRTKVCHFVRTRLLSTYSFLSIQSNQDDASMLLNRCFEQMAQLTRAKTAWIKSVYKTFDEKFQAEQDYQAQVFYPINQQLAEYKNLINNLHLQSQIQKNLLEYISQVPILIQFKHFKTELCSPESVKLPLKILRKILDSFDFLKMTSAIYDLGRFYLLLHQTYAQLIERDELTMMTLQELYERGQRRQKASNRLSYRQNPDDPYLNIIRKGIEAVNAYHRFADGLIQPGACDETQRFTAISLETPISYLLTTENYDEGDIVMRILSVLVDYHNSILNLLENGMNENDGIGLLRALIDKLSTKELSVVQIIQENTGVITLNEQDCSWIERLCRASLEIDNEYFPQSNTQLRFNFDYIQFYIIPTYLLLCRINYRSTHQQYQCLNPRSMNRSIEKKTTANSVYTLNDPQFVHLQEKRLGELFREYNLLRKFDELLRRNQGDVSEMTLHEFLRTTNDKSDILKQIDHCHFPDFELHYIDDVCQLYEQLINSFHYSILNTSPLLRVPMNDALSAALDRILKENFIQAQPRETDNNLQTIVRTINNFLNEFEEIEDRILQQSSLSLSDICQAFAFDSPMVALIPEAIKGENYISLVIKLVELRSQLQEQTIQKEETTKVQWNDGFSEEPLEQEARNIFGENFLPTHPHTIERFPSFDVPLDEEQTVALDYFISHEFSSPDDNDKESLKTLMEIIIEYLNDLQTIEDKLKEDPALSLVNICESESMENSFCTRIPKEIKCENYRAFVIRLMQVRSQLQDQYDEITDPRRFSVPFNDEQMKAFDQFFNENFLESTSQKTIEEFRSTIEKISEFSDELENIRDTILQQLSTPLATACERLSVKNPMASRIPNEINGENYTPFLEQLMERKSYIRDEYEKIAPISVPLDSEQDAVLNQFVEENFIRSASQATMEQLQQIIENLSVFLDELERIKDIIRENPSSLLISVCEDQAVQSLTDASIPHEIKCENYIAFADRLTKIRSQLAKHHKEIVDHALLNVPFTDEQNLALNRFFNDNFIRSASGKSIGRLQSIVQNITDFLDQLERIKDIVRDNLSSSLTTICEEQRIRSPADVVIPHEIKCENFTPLIEAFTRVGLQLEEERRKIARLSVSFNDEQNAALEQFLKNTFIEPSLQNEMENLETLQRTITELLNQIMGMENTFRQQLSQPLATVCEQNGMGDVVTVEIPHQIRCENYFPFISKLIDMRSRIEELGVPFNDEQNMALEQFFNDNFNEPLAQNQIENIETLNQTIRELVNNLKEIEHQLREQRSQSLVIVCEQIPINNPIAARIPDVIKCENYIELMTRLIRLPLSIPAANEWLFQLNIRSVPLTISGLLTTIREQEKHTREALSRIATISRFAFVDRDTNRKTVAWRTENIYQKVKTMFQEKSYNSDELVIVNQDQIFVDFLNTTTDQSSLRLSSEYHVISNRSLIRLILLFESEQREYRVTATCRISSIIIYSIINHRLITTAENVFLGFFDELGSYIDEDRTIEHIYRPMSSDVVRIRLIRYENDTNSLSAVTLSNNGTDAQEKLFHPSTKWAQIDRWLKTNDTITDSYSFYDREEKIVLHKDQTLSSTSSAIDGVSDDDIMTMILSYESNQESIRVLKSSPTNDLLQKEQYRRKLNVQIPADDCILVRKIGNEDEILTAQDLQRPIENYLSNNNEEVHFQIAVLVQIRQYDTNRLIPKSISSRKITIEELLRMVNNNDQTYRYLASSNSHRVLNPNEQLVNLTETRFDLVREIETCSILIDRSNESHNSYQPIEQRYTIFATMADLYTENKGIINNGYLVYDDTAILSHQTSLTYFRSVQSPVRFVLSNRNFDANLTITNEEEVNSFLNFRCSRSVEIKRLCHLACQLFRVNRKYYRLYGADETELDDTVALYELVEVVDDIQAKLVSDADFKCSISYEEQTIIIPASKATKLSTVFDELLKKLFIPDEDIEEYELKIIFNSEDIFEIDLSSTVEEIQVGFSIESTVISLQFSKR